jgi:hypothetical protein
LALSRGIAPVYAQVGSGTSSLMISVVMVSVHGATFTRVAAQVVGCSVLALGGEEGQWRNR